MQRKTLEEIKEKRFVTTHEAAQLLNITPTTVIQWVKDGDIRTVKTKGGHRRIPMTEIEKIMKKMGYNDLEYPEENTI